MSLFKNKSPILLAVILSGLIVMHTPAFAKPEQTAVKSTPAKKSANRIDQINNQAQQLEKNIEAERAKQEKLKLQQEELAEEIEKLQGDMVEAAERAQDQEEALSKLEASLKDLGAQRDKAEKDLLKSHDSLSHVLAAILRLKRQPPQALLAIPQTPAETAHTIVLLKQMTPELDKQVAVLKAQLDAISLVEKTIEEKHSEVIDRSKQLLAEKEKLESLVKKRKAAHAANQKAQEKQEQKIQQLAGQAADLRDLIAKLEEERKQRVTQTLPKPKIKPKSGKEVATIGGIPLPAKGKIVTEYGETNTMGGLSKGLVIETRPQAQVVSPYAGEVVYAGQFRSYGLILIIEVGDGYHIMLSNLGRIDSALGQNLVAGEPVGVMGTGPASPRLYVEFRKNGQPVPPQNWTSPNS
ncbi:MAG: hypothetical protein EYC62_03260 [Alphaproteobacteria bacterium]|nr:MAG: hypothetical protein EYC62_03260 [Alphaproteobacteria bacterium]